MRLLKNQCLENYILGNSRSTRISVDQGSQGRLIREGGASVTFKDKRIRRIR